MLLVTRHFRKVDVAAAAVLYYSILELTDDYVDKKKMFRRDMRIFANRIRFVGYVHQGRT
jgi:hypothetical protein